MLEGTPGDPEIIRERMEALVEQRESTQPVKSKTGGSTFNNPPGHKAWQLIDEAGCRGLMRGAAQVSEKHCNFLINTGDATAADIEGLGEEVRARVKAKSGVQLEWEIKRVGRLNMTKFKRIAVLLGGRSPEREVSLVSGPRLRQGACATKASTSVRFDAGNDLGEQLHDAKPDAAFNALHGRWGEDGCVQGLLELMRIPYTHSGVLASALAMHKERAKEVFRAAGLAARRNASSSTAATRASAT